MVLNFKKRKRNGERLQEIREMRERENGEEMRIGFTKMGMMHV